MYAQDSDGNVISREEILNKFRVQYPDYPDKARHEHDEMEVIQGKIGSARQISFEQLRNDIVLYEHQSLVTSIFFSFQLADSEWPFHQQVLFALAYGIAMYRFARKLQKDAEQNLQATNLWGANHNAIESSILATLSQLVQLKSKDKYFGGENVSIADIEIFTHFQLLSDSGREKLLEKSPPQFQKWHNRMLKFFENQ